MRRAECHSHKVYRKEDMALVRDHWVMRIMPCIIIHCHYSLLLVIVEYHCHFHFCVSCGLFLS